MFLSVFLVIILFDVIHCHKIEETWTSSKNKIHDKIYNVSRTNASNAISTHRTFVPSFRVILLEISLMAISVFLVNSLENYIKAPKNNRPKHRKIDEDIYRNMEDIISNLNK